MATSTTSIEAGTVLVDLTLRTLSPQPSQRSHQALFVYWFIFFQLPVVSSSVFGPPKEALDSFSLFNKGPEEGQGWLLFVAGVTTHTAH